MLKVRGATREIVMSSTDKIGILSATGIKTFEIKKFGFGIKT
jgi:hypothetical protein